MSKSISQDMAYRQSLMKYAEKYGVSRASRKYNKNRAYIYFWKVRWDGTAASLACQSRRPHSHPNQRTEVELKLIRDMRRRNPHLGMVELWHRLRQRGYTRRPESLLQYTAIDEFTRPRFSGRLSRAVRLFLCRLPQKAAESCYARRAGSRPDRVKKRRVPQLSGGILKGGGCSTRSPACGARRGWPGLTALLPPAGLRGGGGCGMLVGRFLKF